MKKLKELYYNPSKPGSLGGVDRLFKHQSGKYTKEQVKNFLRSQETYSRFAPARKRFKRNRYILLGTWDLWEVDLIDLPSLGRFNNGIKYILCVIDCFSKFAFVRPLRQKNMSEVTKQFEDIIKKSGKAPKNLNSDKAFSNKIFSSLMMKYGINHYVSQNPDTKASIIERFIRTYKGKLFRFMSHSGTKKYTDVLEDIVKAYNHERHRSTGYPPAKVGQHNEDDIRQKLNKPTKTHPPKLVVGDTVRISKYKSIFGKGYESSWTSETFKVVEVINKPVPMYKIEDSDGNRIIGSFYGFELLRT